MKSTTLLCLVLCLCGTILSSSALVPNAEEVFIDQSMEVIQIATDSFYSVMPPMFCWKDINDATVLKATLIIMLFAIKIAVMDMNGLMDFAKRYVHLIK